MEKLLEYFMSETNKKFEHLGGEVDKVNEQLSDLKKFRVEMVAGARLTAFIVSTLVGLLSLAATVATVFLMMKGSK